MRFINKLMAALREKKTFVAFLSCEVTYSGRAETFLGRGERVLIVKQDGAVLLHRPDGTTPVNYMKAGSSLTPEEQDGRVILHVKNEREKAWLEIDIHAVYDSLVRRLEDGKRLQLSGNERDMSDYIRDNPHVISAEFTPIGREQQTDVGFIDVFGHDRSGRLIVIECKRVTASLAAADQLRRYVRRVKQVRGTDNVHGIIAAPAITPNALKMLERWEFEFRMVVPPKRLGRWEEGQQRLL